MHKMCTLSRAYLNSLLSAVNTVYFPPTIRLNYVIIREPTLIRILFCHLKACVPIVCSGKLIYDLNATMSSSEAEFDKLASDLYKTLGISSHERINRAAKSGSWKRREERSSGMKVKQDWASERASEPRSSHLKRVSSELASPPAVSSPPNDSAAYTFTKSTETKQKELKLESPPRSTPKSSIGTEFYHSGL